MGTQGCIDSPPLPCAGGGPDFGATDSPFAVSKLQRAGLAAHREREVLERLEAIDPGHAFHMRYLGSCAARPEDARGCWAAQASRLRDSLPAPRPGPFGARSSLGSASFACGSEATTASFACGSEATTYPKAAEETAAEETAGELIVTERGVPLEEARLSPEERIAGLENLRRGLEAMAREGIIYSDLHAGNVVVGTQGGHPRLMRLIDFSDCRMTKDTAAARERNLLGLAAMAQGDFVDDAAAVAWGEALLREIT